MALQRAAKRAPKTTEAKPAPVANTTTAPVLAAAPLQRANPTTLSAAEANELQALRAENERLRQAAIARSKITFKASEKGALSMYGIGRFPLTLYVSQWEAVLQHADEIKANIVDGLASGLLKASKEA